MNKLSEQPILRDIKGKILEKHQIIKILNSNLKSQMGVIESTGDNLYISAPDGKYGYIDFTWENWNTEVEIIGTIQENPELLTQLSQNTISPTFFQILNSKTKLFSPEPEDAAELSKAFTK